MVFFPENMILFFRRKMKDVLSPKILGNMIFSIYLVKMVLLFPANMILKKAKMIFSRKSVLKDDISGIIEKDDIHPRKMVFLLIEKLKIIQKFTLYGDLYTRFHILHSNEKNRKLKFDFVFKLYV